ncbi:hypothetical protein AB9P05_23025 [Roseivirga sp. BDSF3-8]|uniref:hypothetical protein n=1 Tax=Roseivirga sp. BDSF3-8 TaxID=3241598 RepID=UPI0035327649
MRFLIKILLIALVTYFTSGLLPWWAGALAAFLVCLFIPTRGFISFLSGFLGVGLLWLAISWLIDSQTESRLTERVGTIFTLNSSFLLVILTALIGALSGGLGALSGHLFRALFFNRKKRKKAYY